LAPAKSQIYDYLQLLLDLNTLFCVRLIGRDGFGAIRFDEKLICSEASLEKLESLVAIGDHISHQVLRQDITAEELFLLIRDAAAFEGLQLELQDLRVEEKQHASSISLESVKQGQEEGLARLVGVAVLRCIVVAIQVSHQENDQARHPLLHLLGVAVRIRVGVRLGRVCLLGGEDFNKSADTLRVGCCCEEPLSQVFTLRHRVVEKDEERQDKSLVISGVFAGKSH